MLGHIFKNGPYVSIHRIRYRNIVTQYPHAPTILALFLLLERVCFLQECPD
jgi:hypothetical protein